MGSQVRLFFEGGDGNLRLANHQNASPGQSDDRRCASEDREGCSQFEQRRTAVVSRNRSANGNQRGRGEQSQPRVKKAQRFEEQLRTRVQGRQLIGPCLVVGTSRLDRGQFCGYNASAVDDSRQAVTGSEGQHGRRVGQDRRGNYRRQDSERVAGNGCNLQKERLWDRNSLRSLFYSPRINPSINKTSIFSIGFPGVVYNRSPQQEEPAKSGLLFPLPTFTTIGTG